MRLFLSSIAAAITSLFFSQSVLAQYCIFKEPEKSSSAPVEVSWNEDLPKVNVIKNGREYTITIDEINQNQLLLFESGETEPIAQMTLESGGLINEIALGQDDWLWINRNAINYIMKVDFSAETAYFDTPIKLPELTTSPCHIARRLLQECKLGEYNYSPSLNRVFVSGYSKKPWSKHNYVHSEYIQGEEQPIPEPLEQAVFIADIPEWNGALFRQPSGKAIFYDGVKILDISQDFLKLEEGQNFQDWDIRKTQGGRTFIGKFIKRSPEDPLFLLELTAQPGFSPIYLPEDFKYKWLEVATLPDDPKSNLWILTGKSIFTQTDGEIQTVASVASSSFIMRPQWENDGQRQINPEAISLTIKNSTTESTTDYLFRLAWDRENCEIAIDFDQPIILNE